MLRAPLSRTATILGLFLVELLGGPLARGAQPPQLEASISSDHVALDETLQLSITLSRDASQVYQGYVRPEPKDFDVLSSAQSEATQWTMVNGRQSTRTIEQHVYLLRPKHKGPCTIPAATVRIDGHELRTRELVVRVSPASRKPAGAAGPALPGAATPAMTAEPEGMRGDEDVFIEARIDRPQVYVGEQVIVSWTLYSRAEILHYRATAEPRQDDFWSEDLYTPQRLSWERQVVKGQEYIASRLLVRALFPLRAGRFTITPLEAELTTLQTAFYAGGSAVRASKPLTVEVLPLPAAGRPQGFEATNVGQFELAGGADRTELKAGEALTYKVQVKGRGNLRNVKLPQFERIDGFKVYEPTVNDAVRRSETGVEGEKTVSYLLLPRRGGVLKIPPLTLTYFDPQAKKYQSASVPEVAIAVAGDPDKIGSAPSEARENVLKPTIKPLRVRRTVESHFGERLLRGHALALSLAVPPVLLLGVVGFGAARDRLRRDTAGSRRRRARAQARRRMRAAEVHVKAEQPSQFFAECARAIYEQLEYRVGTKCEAYTIDELRRVLVERGFAEAVAQAVAEELSACDFARFGASASGSAEMRAALERVRELLGSIEHARLAAPGVTRAGGAA